MIPTEGLAQLEQETEPSASSNGAGPDPTPGTTANTVDPNNPRKSIIRDCLIRFTTQHTPAYLESLCSYILDPKGKIDEIQNNHPNIVFMLNSIEQAISRYCPESLFLDTNYLEKIKSPSYLDYLYDQIVQYLLDRIHCITGDISTSFLSELSGLPYESSFSENQSIAIIFSSDSEEAGFKSILDVSFDKKYQNTLTYQNIRAIRKQLNMTKDIALGVKLSTENAGYVTIGLISKSKANDFPKIVFRKNMDWEYHMPDKNNIQQVCFRFFHGVPMIPLTQLTYEVRSIVECVFGEKNADQLLNIILATEYCKKGAILIIANTETIKGECKDLLENNNRGILLDKRLYLDSNTVKGKENTLTRLLNIDGALLIDDQGYCHACGVILDGAIDRSYDGTTSSEQHNQQFMGNPARGSRYNSTHLYVSYLKSIYNDPTILGVVRSEDGMLDFFE